MVERKKEKCRGAGYRGVMLAGRHEGGKWIWL